MALDAGSRIAQYRLERRLGAGGMGEVFLARDTQLDRLVAIKFLVSPADDQARRRLLREARASAGLEHPGICAVYEVGTDPVGGDFIAMQYIEGETLGARLKRGRLRPDEALAIGARIADALSVAHHHGIVHRDLKPQNIILTPSGAPKLLDFGLATHVAGGKEAADAPTMSQLSEAHLVAGTPGYMAPEQIRNEPADSRTDVFALGCVLYECLTGRRAFQGATAPELMGQVLHVDPPPVSSIVPELGPPYDALCARLLHKAPDERFQSAEEVLGAIRALTPSARFSSGTAPAIAAPRRLSVGRRAALAGAVVVIALVVLWQWPRQKALPVPPHEAAGWYDRGVEAMRDGTYASARDAFAEAVKLFPQYAQAYYRLAEAQSALDDERSAQSALLQVVPDLSALGGDDQDRFEAARAFAVRNHPRAIELYRKIADAQPGDAGRWLDVGRAEEMAGRRAAARVDYAKAVELDGQYAAARLRLGILQAQAGQTAEGLASIDEAIRLYRIASKTEGEAQALLGKGIALVVIGQFDKARQSLELVLQFATDPKYAGQRIKAQLQLARITYMSGKFTEAEELARRAVTDATDAGLQPLAASALLDLGNSLMSDRRYEAADAQYLKAIDLASSRDAKRVEMRVRLQRASLKQVMNLPQEALDLSEAPRRYFSETNDARLAVTAKLIASRATEDLERYDEAKQLAIEALRFAESSKDDALVATAMDNLAGQLTKLGQLPEALGYREQIDAIHRRQNDTRSLPFDLTNHADLLIQLGRFPDAEPLLAEVEAAIAAGDQAYVGRRIRVAGLRALMATIQRRHADVPGLLGPEMTDPLSKALAEHALAQLGKSRTPAATIARWPAEAKLPVDRREAGYWVALTLLARREPALANVAAQQALKDPIAQVNPELGWRLAAVLALVSRATPGSSDGASMAAQFEAKTEALKATWGGAASAYLARPDLTALQKAAR